MEQQGEVVEPQATELIRTDENEKITLNLNLDKKPTAEVGGVPYLAFLCFRDSFIVIGTSPFLKSFCIIPILQMSRYRLFWRRLESQLGTLLPVKAKGGISSVGMSGLVFLLPPFR